MPCSRGCSSSSRVEVIWRVVVVGVEVIGLVVAGCSSSSRVVVIGVVVGGCSSRYVVVEM